MSGKLVGGIFLSIGVVITSAGGYFLWSSQGLLADAQRAPGKVVEMRRGGRYYTPVVQFEVPDQGMVTATCKTGSNPPRHAVGDSVTVLYRAKTPEDIVLDEPLELYLVPCILGGIGVIFVIVGGALLLFSKS